MNKLNDSLPIIDPISKKVLGVKKRSLVHQDGDWHYSIQAYILRKNTNNKIEVLVQKRSPQVDISKLMFDQSIAVQMIESDKNIEAALERGIQTELGISIKNVKYQQIFSTIDLHIIKTYKQEINVLNREILKLYLIDLNLQNLHINPVWIDEYLWVSFEELFSWQKSSPDLFTKTSRFYAVDPYLSKQIINHAELFMSNTSIPKHLNIKNITYYSEAQSIHDTSIHKMKDGKEKYFILNSKDNFIIETDTQHPSSSLAR